jgi:hypothetical protein
MTSQVKTTDDIISRMMEEQDYMELSTFLAPIIAAGLKKIREAAEWQSPSALSTVEWQSALDKMINAFEIIIEDDPLSFERNHFSVAEGLSLFSTYYNDLWI